MGSEQKREYRIAFAEGATGQTKLPSKTAT
jgi:hypothetical protein